MSCFLVWYFWKFFTTTAPSDGPATFGNFKFGEKTFGEQ